MLMQNLVYQTVTGKSVNKFKNFVNYLSSVFPSVPTHNARLDLLDNNWVTNVNAILGRVGGIFEAK